jgi:hypothetical protein
MVNLKKWEKIEHEDVKLGDNLKIVWISDRPTKKTTEVHKGNVRRVDGNGDFYLNGTGWEPGEPRDGTCTTIYRRKPEAFVFPNNLGAVIEGTPKHREGATRRRYIRLAGRWVQESGSVAFEDALACNFVDWVVLSKGVVTI